MNNNTVKLIILLLALILLSCVIYSNPREKFNATPEIVYSYFSLIFKASNFEITVMPNIQKQLHSSQFVESKLSTFVILDKNIFESPVEELKIVVNGIDTSTYYDLLNCNFKTTQFNSSQICIYKIPNEIINTNVTKISINKDLYLLNKSNPTFIGLLFILQPDQSK